MHVGVCRVILRLPACRNLKEKRSISRSVNSRVRAKFNVAISEVDDVELWQKLTLGIACVSNDQAYANGILSNVVEYIESSRPDLELLDYELELLSGI